MQEIKNTTIFDYGFDGEGVGKIDGKICFVPYSIKDENIDVKIIKENANFTRGEIITIHNPSNLRIKPLCPYFGKCGGCAYQHMPYQEELTIKKELFSRQLKKVNYTGQIDIIASSNHYYYRNKIRLFVKNGKLGLKKRGSNDIVEIKSCQICKEEIGDAISKVDLFLSGKKIYHLFDSIEIEYFNNQGIIIFYKNRICDVDYQGLILNLLNDFNIYESYKKQIKTIFENNNISFTSLGIKVQLSPFSFHQVNDEVAKELYNRVISNINGEFVLNCYSGGGLLSGMICKSGKKVIAIELGKHEHEEAERLKYHNALKGLTNIRGDCGKELKNLNLDFDTIIVDPPRGGLDNLVATNLNDRRLERLIYISCDSAPLIRDLLKLTNYKINRVYLLDMFARTGEYECLVILDKFNSQLKNV